MRWNLWLTIKKNDRIRGEIWFIIYDIKNNLKLDDIILQKEVWKFS